MQSIEPEQPQKADQPSPADVLAVHLLFKRIAERGRRIRMQREAADQQEGDDKPTEEKFI